MEYLNRKLSKQEEKLLEILVEKSSANIPSDWKLNLLVQPMSDEGMGSLILLPPDVAKENRSFGEQISEWQFTDEDGIEVIVSLNLDNHGKLFELDIWKTDFSPLINIPHR